MIGLIVDGTQKTFAISRANLDHEAYITEVLSIGCVFNAGRSIWAFLLDHYSFKKVFGVLLALQTFLGLTYYFSARTRATYALWVWLQIWCEGGHFSVLPNILNIIYGEHATYMYGGFFCFTAIDSFIDIGLLSTNFATEYFWFYGFGSACSLVALIILLTMFNQEKFADRKKK